MSSGPVYCTLSAVAALILLVGCGPDYMGADWQDAPETHRCTEDQMQRVHKEAEWCDKNTHYYGRYCYGTAMLRLCERVEGEQEDNK